MPPSGEEIYVTLVVVRRPPRGNQPVDPNRWIQAILDGLAAQGAIARVESVAPSPPTGGRIGRRANFPQMGGAPPMLPVLSRRTRSDDRRTRLLLSLSALCFLGSAFSFYLLSR